ncbi:aminoglycoside phosphotransferase family protein [Nonomuraea sp. NPDC050790]|uniref:aminoglycoside phosphotransferase family protein n=1 Tax=Nonomuraea sp. NPDC050790 TaxID=3364371 RepID=UPI003794D402
MWSDDHGAFVTEGGEAGVVYAEVPLTAAVRRACRLSGPATRLHGGEESAAWRVGDKVVRISAYAKDLAEAEWCHRVAGAARAGGCTEAVVPLPLPGRADGATVMRIEGRTVSLWPYVDGVWVPKDNLESALAAARLLARLHRALAKVELPPRPRPSLLDVGQAAYDDPELHDPQLDNWLSDFTTRSRLWHPLHGDYYRGNLLTAHDDPTRIIGVLDWDEALVAPPEVEVAGAAMEFTPDFSENLAQPRQFAQTYRRSGGTAESLDDESLVQLMRHRLRRESVYFTQAAAQGVEQDEEDLDYHRRRLAAFTRLRP